MEQEELSAWLRLTLTPGVGSETARKLLAAFGLPQNILAQSETALARVAGPSVAQALKREPAELAELLARTQAWLAEGEADAQVQRRIVTLGDAAYPAALLQIEDPPPLLYLLGRADLALDAEQALAIVGSRNPTPQGVLNARQFARVLREAGLTIVSGLALGVDGAAHEGALDGIPAGTDPLATIAVVGTGLDRVYPKAHRELAHRIARHGLLISEYPLGTPPLAPNFPRRNRLIAGLARGTLVVEAALQSGSLITARLAAEQGREVFAIPGSIHATQSRGCHALIRQGAKLVESAQDVLEDLHGLSGPRNPTVSAEPAKQPDELLTALGFDPVSLDALAARTGLDAAHLQARLMALELDGTVTRLPGGLFQHLVKT